MKNHNLISMIKKYLHLLNTNKLFVSLIILIVVIVFIKSFYHGIIFLDDDTLIHTKFQGMELGDKISFSFTSNYLDTHYYRPIALLSVIGDSLLGGQSYFIYHFSNFILHLFTSILIFLILKEFGVTNIISFLATMFFAVNPIQINAVGWIAGRGDLLAGFFTAAGLLIFLNFIKLNRPYLLIFVSILLFLAFLSKEVSLLVPFLFLTLYFIEKKNYELNKNSISVLVMTAAVIGSYYLLRGLFLPGVHIDKFSFTTYYRNILVLPETVSKFFIPTGIKALAGIEGFTSVAGTILLIILFVLPFMLRSVNRARYYFGLLWFVLLLIPGMVFRTMGQDGFYYWDCRSYLPLIGFAFMISEVLKVVVSEKSQYSYYALILTYLIISGTVTFIKIQLYENPLTYWNSVKSDYPSSFLPYVGLFNYYTHIKDTYKAEKQLLQAVDIRPEELRLRIKLVNFYEKQQSYTNAVSFLRKTLINDKIYSDYLAEKYLSLSIKLTPNNDENLKELIDTYRAHQNIIAKINRMKISLNNNSGTGNVNK